MRASIQKIQLTGTIVIAVSSILLATLAALPSVSSYLRYRTNAQQLSRFETALQSAWLVSAERGPANNLMGASSPMQNWSRLPQRARRRTTSWWNSKTLLPRKSGRSQNWQNRWSIHAENWRNPEKRSIRLLHFPNPRAATRQCPTQFCDVQGGGQRQHAARQDRSRDHQGNAQCSDRHRYDRHGRSDAGPDRSPRFLRGHEPAGEQAGQAEPPRQIRHGNTEPHTAEIVADELHRRLPVHTTRRCSVSRY